MLDSQTYLNNMQTKSVKIPGIQKVYCILKHNLHNTVFLQQFLLHVTRETNKNKLCYIDV